MTVLMKKTAYVLACAFVFLGIWGDTPAFGKPAYSPRWQWPTGQPVQVTKSFDPPSQPWLAGHRGIDLLLPPGTTIRAVESGKIVYAAILVDRGVVSIEHGDGLRSTYEPIDPHVSVGDNVTPGQEIGTVATYTSGSGHDANTMHLGAKIGSKQYIDPLLLLIGQISLKPWP